MLKRKHKIWVSWAGCWLFTESLALFFGLYVFGIGLWGLVNPAPLVISGAAADVVSTFMLSTHLPFSLLCLWSTPGARLIRFLLCCFHQVAMLALLVFVFWRQMTGYMIFGVSDDTFRMAWSALDEIKSTFQGTISKIKLTGPRRGFTGLGRFLDGNSPNSHESAAACALHEGYLPVRWTCITKTMRLRCKRSPLSSTCWWAAWWSFSSAP